MTKKPIVVQGKNGRKRCSLEDLETISQRLFSYVRRKKCSLENPLQVTVLKQEDPSLYYQLSLYGYALSEQAAGKGVLNPQFALQRLNIPTAKALTSDEMAAVVREVLPRTLAEEAYAAMHPSYDLKKRFYAHSVVGQQVYRAFFNPARRDFKPRRFEKIINGLYPDLTERFGASLMDAFHGLPYSEEFVAVRLQELFYAGGDITASGLRTLSGGTALVHTIERKPFSWGQGSLPLKNKRADKKKKDPPPASKSRSKKWNKPFAAKIVDYLGIPGVGTDLLNIRMSNVKSVAHIQERQLLFLLNILQCYDPSCAEMSEEWREYFPPRINSVFGPEERKKVECLSNGIDSDSQDKKVLEADGRVSAGGLEILLEVKGHKQMEERHIDTMLGKYDSVARWRDRARIDRKVVLLCHGSPRISDLKKKCETAGWLAIDSTQFARFYERGLAVLLDNDPNFFVHLGMPALGSKDLLAVHREVSHSSHLLQRHGRQYEAAWLAEFLRKATDYVRSGRRDQGLEIPEQRVVIPFSHFSNQYGESVNRVCARDTLFLDLETAGFRNTGSPIAVLGMAYEQNGEMITDVLFVRHPREEKAVLQRFKEIIPQYKTIVTFNGKTFDEGFLLERMAAHCLPIDTKQYEHIDLYPEYRNWARRNNYPRAFQQTYERTVLQVKRQQEIPGSKIPAAYADYAYAGDVSLIPAMIHHNQLDLITLTLMYQDLWKKR